MRAWRWRKILVIPEFSINMAKLIDDLANCPGADEESSDDCEHKVKLQSFILRAREIRYMEV